MPAPVLAATTGDGDTGTTAADAPDEPDDEPTGRALPETLSSADFRRAAAQVQRSLKSKCPGLPGFEVGARVYVDASGQVTRVVPEGRQAGSSFSTCVAKLIRQTRFKQAHGDSVHSATFKP